MKKAVIVLSALVLAALICAQAEEIQLKDGTKVTGTITSVSRDKFQVKTSYGDIQVPRSEIVSISFPENAPAKEEEAKAPDIEQTLDGRNYVNKTEQFQLTLANGWLLAPQMLNHDIHGAAQSEDQTLFFFYTPEKFAGTPNTYLVLAQSDFEARFDNFEKISQTEVTLDGRKVTRLLWHGKNKAANNAAIKALVYVVPFEGKMVRLSFLTLEPLFDDALPTFEKMAASYHSTAK